MFRITINQISAPNQPYVNDFDSEQEALDWMAMRKTYPGFLEERVVHISDSYSQDDVLEVIESEIDGQMIQTHVRLKAQASYQGPIDVSAEYNAQQDMLNKIKAGEQARLVCQKVLDFIAGVNLDRELTSEQITQMQSSFQNIQLSLQASRPSLAKSLIQNAEVDGVIVTQELKDGCLSLLSNY